MVYLQFKYVSIKFVDKLFVFEYFTIKKHIYILHDLVHILTKYLVL